VYNGSAATYFKVDGLVQGVRTENRVRCGTVEFSASKYSVFGWNPKQKVGEQNGYF